jgi:hypothetical protein
MRTLLLGLSAWLVAIGAAAQDPGRVPIQRGDLHFTIGWQNLHKEQPVLHYNDWLNNIFYGGAGAGWYWTDHVKTQVDVGAGTRGRQFRYEPIVVNGQQTSTSSRVSVSQQSVAIGQHYQFFENQWFHPHVGAGVDLARETTREDYDPVIVFDQATRQSRQASPARTEGPDHRLIARPFGEVGLKAYMTRRAFFTADSRVMFRHGVDEVLFRLGFGVDF